MKKHSRSLRTAQAIRETINNLPGGVCLSTLDGRPILTNRRMNDLVYTLTGHTIMDALATWDELSQITSANGCVRLDELMPWLSDGNAPDGDSLLFQFPYERVWRFRREELRDRRPFYFQLDASDISELYQYSKELFETNRRLAQQHARQQNLLTNIVEINHEKELLRAKMRIHDELGQSILITKQHLSDGTLSENIPELTGIWNSTIRCLSDFPVTDVSDTISPKAELERVAGMIGCTINFSGVEPIGRRSVLLFYAAVREALINAVRHANADRLDVNISQTDSVCHVVISDNGSAPAAAISEGNGLSHLRKRLEQEGARLEIKNEGGVVLAIDLPLERRKNPRLEESKW